MDNQVKRPQRTRSAKVNLWMKPELVTRINQKAEDAGLSRDGAFEQGMALWVSRKLGAR